MNAAGRRDAQLVGRIQRGDAAAFAGLVRLYERKLYRQVLRIVKDHSDADDVMQDALIRIYSAIKTFRGDACLYTWMYRIATNSALSLLAGRKRKLVEMETSGPDFVLQGFESRAWDDPEQQMYGEQMAKAVGDALDAMRPECRTAITLREFDGLSYDEIADAMVCPVGTVKSRISTARLAISLKLKLGGFPSSSSRA